MSQDFKLKFDEMRNNTPANKTGDGESLYQTFDSQGHVRKLRFSWPTGETLVMNYAFLIKHDYKPDQNTLTLYYTTDTIIVKGMGLEQLDDDLFFNIPKIIEITEDRYGSLSNSKIVVTEIKVSPKE